MTEFTNGPTFEELRAVYLEDALKPGGVLHDIAMGALQETVELAPHDVADVLMPPKAKENATDSVPRWVLVEEAPTAVKEGAMASQTRVFEMAKRLDMRRDEVVSAEDLARIDADSAIWVIEGGANRTSIVRRELALQAMRGVYGNGINTRKALYQLGSDRAIPRERKGKLNPEYGVAQQIAGDFLPDDDSLTEFGLNIAAAKQAGYREIGDKAPQGISEVVWLEKAGSPILTMVKPIVEVGGTYDGLTAANYLAGTARGARSGQFIIATNGQYRPKVELQAQQWAASHPELTMLAPVAFGDEPGYSVEHASQTITTADRAALIYVNEAVKLHRLFRA